MFPFTFLENPVGLMFTIIAVGISVGNLPLGPLRLGASGVLIAGLIFGHFGFILPKEFQTIGVVLFVYATGLKAGPYIWASLKKSKGSFFILAFVIVIAAGLTALLLKWSVGLSPRMTVGIFAGSMTSTPALAAAIEALGDSSASVGYGLAYPFGILGVIILVQLLPKLLGISIEKEAETYQSEMMKSNVIRKAFRVTNTNVTNRSLAEVMSEIHGEFRVARLKRGEQSYTPNPADHLKLNDVVLVVGAPQELSKLSLLIGEETEEVVPYSQSASSRWTMVTSKKMAGRKIGKLEIGELYGVIITRVKRGGIEFSPSAHFVLEIGDEIRISGKADDLSRFETVVKKDTESVHETDLFAFSVGLALGVLVGMIKVPVTPHLNLGLGIAGGPLIMGLLFGHFGRFGNMVGRMPKAAMLITGELGLFFFLATAGCAAGISFFHVLAAEGISLILCGAAITIVPILAAIIVGRYILKLNFLVLLGMICGGMTSTPAIGILTKHTKSEIPALGYTGIYPLAVLLTTLAAQILVFF